MTFHGTQIHHVANIVRFGFLMPGAINPATGKRLEVRCGSTYGCGIYSSPSAEFSISYCNQEDGRPEVRNPKIKILVCATLMGRAAQMYSSDNWRSQTQPYPNADSHIANEGNEYVVFSNMQIVPCYVIHFNRIEEKVSPTADTLLHLLGHGDEFGVGKEERKAALKMRAAKHFPFGFGTATGSRFTIEAVADGDSDEEEYGEYQADRADGQKWSGDPNNSFWEWDLDAGGDDTALNL